MILNINASTHTRQTMKDTRLLEQIRGYLTGNWTANSLEFHHEPIVAPLGAIIINPSSLNRTITLRV